MKATLKTVLIYYDGPQLLHLLSTNKNNAIAVAIDHSEFANAYFACEVRDKDFARYIDGRVDLRYLFLRPMRSHYYIIDGDKLGAVGENTVMNLIKSKKEVLEEYFPLSGLFSRTHTQNPDLQNELAVESGQRVYKIDGRWEATDFSRFYSKMADLYALFAILDETWDTLSAGAKAKFEIIISTKMFQGGGSYVGFYDQIYDQFIRVVIEPLRLKQISYASPGQVTFSGDAKALNDVVEAIGNNEEKKVDLARKYKNIRGILQRQKLLRRGPQSGFLTDDQSAKVKLDSDNLATSMGLVNTKALYEASGSSSIVYAKIVLSIYRRLDELTAFQEEGRVIFDPKDEQLMMPVFSNPQP